MHSWLCLLALLAAVALNLSLALPLNLNDVVETAETDEQLLALLAGQSMEDESASIEHARTRRMPIEDPDLVVHDRHADELAHERRGERQFGRERRAAGKDSSASSEEVGKAPSQKADKSNSSSEETQDAKQQPEQQLEHAVGQQPQEQPHEKPHEQPQEQPHEQPQEQPQEQPHEQTQEQTQPAESARRKREAPLQKSAINAEGTDVLLLALIFDYINKYGSTNVEDYVQGCGLLEPSSDESSIDTILDE